MPDEEQRLEALNKALKEREPAPQAEPEQSGTGAVWRVAGDMLGGVIVGGGAGFALDYWLGTTPWLFLVCFCFGVAASARMIMRLTAVDKE
jgi:ATP synthase protein I